LTKCERAVKLSEGLEPPDNWQTRDSRALARALSGNVPGAIDDFQFLIDHADAKSDARSEDLKRQRREWVETLRKGQNPLTPAVIEQLFGQ